MARKLVVEIIGDASSLERSFGRARRSTSQFERESGKAFRGVASGSGAFRSLGRSVAFASGAFIGFSSATAIIKQSIDAATQAAATQRQLAAQFRASGKDLKDYQARIEETTNRLSRLAGFNRDELTQSFLVAFRATRNVSTGLRIEVAAANAARATHRDLGATTLALAKAVEGSSGSLKRLGIILPSNIRGVRILDAVMKRFSGQARAGTTAQERLNAAIHNTEEIVGAALLPAINKLANSISLWLSKSKNQKRLQDDVTIAVQDTTEAVKLLAAAFNVATKFAQAYMNVAKNLGKATQPLGTVFKVLFLPGFGLKALADSLSGSKGHGPFTPPGLAGPVGSTGGGGGGLLPGLTGPVGAAGGSVSSGPNAATLAFQRLFGVVRKTIHDVPADIAKAAAAADAARQKLAALRLSFANARQAFHDAFTAALADARGTIGTLFAGPVLQPSADALKARLGVRIAGTKVGSLTSDLNAQVAQATQFFKDLARLRSRGASAQLVDELRQGGDIAQAHALAGASPAALRAFLKAFQARERLASRVAIQTPAVRIAAQHVTLAGRRLNADGGHVNVNVYVDGQKVPATVKTTQRRGRHAGTRG